MLKGFIHPKLWNQYHFLGKKNKLKKIRNSMAKFKVGTNVKISDSFENTELILAEPMQELIGTIGVITDYDETTDHYQLDHKYFWPESALTFSQKKKS